MLYIRWNEENELGIDIVDEQHRGVVSAINSFYYGVSQGLSKQSLRLTKGMLDEMTIMHFETEERFLEQMGYPHIHSHALLHQKLLGKMGEIFEESIANNDPDPFLKFLKNWWLHHINEEDRVYARYLESNGKLP